MTRIHILITFHKIDDDRKKKLCPTIPFAVYSCTGLENVANEQQTLYHLHVQPNRMHAFYGIGNIMFNSRKSREKRAK